MENIENNYIKRIQKYESLLKRQRETINFISALRMITFISAIVFSIVSYYRFHNYYLLVLSIVIFTSGFLLLAKKQDKLIKNKGVVEKICQINEKSVIRMKGDWKGFKDDGNEFIDEEHSYSKDLDLFGKASLFQYLNETTTYMGRKELKNSLENCKFSIDQIYERQEAIKEMAHNIAWRQRLQSEGLCINNNEDVKKLIIWGKEKCSLYNKKSLKFFTLLLPTITLITIIMYFTKYISFYYPLFMLFVQAVILKIKNDERNNALDMVYHYKKIIGGYANMLKLIGEKNFQSKYLKEIKEKIMNNEENKALKGIRALSNISGFTSDRKNLFYILSNILLLWDYRCMIMLENWKKQYSYELEKWLCAIGRTEEISSLSIMCYENPQWTMPKFNKNSFSIKGKKVGHPLLDSEKVCNDFTIGEDHKILLITGSNMSGKSTFLRTVGINILLAQIGSVVCATEFCCSKMDIYTCMRINDNLERNISSFYGEILRIKKLMKGVKSGKPILFLLDEIFKGTNSLDRHTGAEILINKLSNENVLGLVSTHDLELGDLENKNSKVKNYHFKEYYKNNKIYFDYKLKPGVSTTRNALYLMKMAGIDM